jgi:hypothetical protein
MFFEDIKPGSRLRGLDPSGIAEVVQVSRFGPDALNLVFRANGRVGERLVYRGEESAFEFTEPGRPFGFDADGGLLRLASEAYRIRLAYLFDPYLAVSASQIEALPHQITAVYGEMLPRQPLRFHSKQNWKPRPTRTSLFAMKRIEWPHPILAAK